jgi:hypothetical protein
MNYEVWCIRNIVIRSCFNAATQSGWPDEFVKNRQNCSPTHFFCQNLKMTYFVGKVSQKYEVRL